MSHDPIDVVVAGLHLRWNGVWQRPNHLLARVARAVPVIVIEEPLVTDRDADDIDRSDGLTVVTPRRSAGPDDALDARGLATVRRLVGTRRPLVWLYTPMMLALADTFPGAPLVFDKMDELAKFAQADPRIAAREQELLARADFVFTGGRSLQRTVADRTQRATCYPSGVDVEHFARARGSLPHPALRPYLDRPIFGYVGVIDERIDLDLVAALAAAHPGATIAMVGPVLKIAESALPRRPNIVYLGQRGYDELPALLAGFDVALMPFALNPHTANISPTKTLEYLAAGLPVVSSAVPDVVADHADVVHVAHDQAEFVRLVEQARQSGGARRDAGEAKARRASWDAIATAMRADLAEAGIVYPAPACSSSAALA